MSLSKKVLRKQLCTYLNFDEFYNLREIFISMFNIKNETNDDFSYSYGPYCSKLSTEICINLNNNEIIGGHKAYFMREENSNREHNIKGCFFSISMRDKKRNKGKKKGIRYQLAYNLKLLFINTKCPLYNYRKNFLKISIDENSTERTWTKQVNLMLDGLSRKQMENLVMFINQLMIDGC